MGRNGWDLRLGMKGPGERLVLGFGKLVLLLGLMLA